jgi:hypothetical protein
MNALTCTFFVEGVEIDRICRAKEKLNSYHRRKLRSFRRENAPDSFSFRAFRFVSFLLEAITRETKSLGINHCK